MIFKNMAFSLFNMSNQVRVIFKSTIQNQTIEWLVKNMNQDDPSK
jgi:hypothetical protein